jgi:predicted nucleic acid-binding protein
VLDACVAVAAARPAEPGHAASKRVVARILDGTDEMTRPAIFSVEIAAALVRRGEAAAAVNDYVDALEAVATRIVTIGPRGARSIRGIAMACSLRAADATYVWVAARAGATLCTLDAEMLERAGALCRVVPP